MKRKTIPATLLFLFFALLANGPIAAKDTLHQGSWTKKTQKIEGTWKIVKEGSRTFVELDSAFSTKKAPDLKIFLSPLSVEDVGNKNATNRSVLVSQLSSHRGAQRYEIPSSADLSKFKTVIIHCEKYSKLWGAGEL